MPIDFVERLLRGRIAEFIFQEMLRETKMFTVIPFGYEYTFPVLADHQNQPEIKNMLSFIRKSPDFAVVSKTEQKVYLVEVKYRTSFHPRDALEIAEGMLEHWDLSWLFIATSGGFLFSSCGEIKKTRGKMEHLSLSWVPKYIQDKYLDLLRRYEKGA